ncbi:hypothetical protein JOD69_000548 [Methylocaldum sp. RMAD-M]|nr:hypothetical protein [Methylocaldum sp. RMAD-M]
MIVGGAIFALRQAEGRALLNQAITTSGDVRGGVATEVPALSAIEVA